MLEAYRYDERTAWVPLDELAQISDAVDDSGALVWVQSSIEDLTASNVAMVAEELGLHPLAVEDALHPRQRPKLESYEQHLFAVLHKLEEHAGQLEAVQIACFVGRNFVLTVHGGAENAIREAMKRSAQSTKELGQGPSFIMHALLDVIVDDYSAIADRLEDEMESVEEAVLADPRSIGQPTVYSLRQRLARLRRYVVPGERVLGSMVNGAQSHLVSERTRAYFRDIHDHTLRILDQVQNVQALADAAMELLRAEQATALNEVTKRLTGWAAIIAVPTLIASVYGMNFRLVPTDERLGFWFALGMMSATGISLYAFFKRRGWL